MATVALILKESSQLLEKISGRNAKREAKILLEFTLDSISPKFLIGFSIINFE